MAHDVELPSNDNQALDPTSVQKLDVFVYRAPIKTPVETSFGIMRDRPAVFVRVEDADGAFGWGEIFANWPAAGAEHRARLLMEDIADLFIGRRVAQPAELYGFLERATHIRALQCGEWGPFRQVIAGVDTAMHDLFSRRKGVPLCTWLRSGASNHVPAYASGIHPTQAEAMVNDARATGFRAFKIKVGFDFDGDVDEIRRRRAALDDDEKLFTDANQAWDPDTAAQFLKALDGQNIGWLEEPIPADSPAADWRRLAKASSIPLAGGENIAGHECFQEAISDGALRVIQPDVAKWGGVTGCFGVGVDAVSKGRAYCPHFLGGGVGLLASAHLLAAVGGEGLLEVDVNPNPLRDCIARPQDHVDEGNWRLSDAPGLGLTTLPEEIERLRTMAASRTSTGGVVQTF